MHFDLYFFFDTTSLWLSMWPPWPSVKQKIRAYTEIHREAQRCTEKRN